MLEECAALVSQHYTVLRDWSQALTKMLTMLLTALSVLINSVLPNPLGSTAKTSFPLTKAEITSLCYSFRINPRL